MSEKKAPCVDMRTDMVKDVRFTVLGELAGYNRQEAWGRMFELWAWCTDRGLKDAPEESDGYVVSDAVVMRFLGPKGVNAILGDGIDEFALAERFTDGRLYLRGTSDYVAARRANLRSARAGGEARARGDRGPDGRFGNPDNNRPADDQPDPSGSGAVRQPTPAPSSSPSSSSSDPRSESPEESHNGRGSLSVLSDDWIPEATEPFRRAERAAREKGLDVAIELQKFIADVRAKGWKRRDWTSAFVKWLLDARAAPKSSSPSKSKAAAAAPLRVVDPPQPAVRELTQSELDDVKKLKSVIDAATNFDAATDALRAAGIPPTNEKRHEGRTHGAQPGNPRTPAKEATG